MAGTSFGGKTGSTEVARRFHGGSTEVSGPTPKNSCNLRRNPHIPQNALNSQVFNGALQVRPNVGCEPPPLQSCRVCFVSGGVVDPKLTKDPDAVVSRWVSGFRLLSFMVLHVGFMSLMLGAFKFTV